jgi:ATP-dependent Clp protease protease subunit
MIHQPLISGHLSGVTTDIKIRAEQINKKKRIINDILAEATGKTFKQIDEDTDRDYFMDASESLAYGIIDQIGEIA